VFNTPAASSPENIKQAFPRTRFYFSIIAIKNKANEHFKPPDLLIERWFNRPGTVSKRFSPPCHTGLLPRIFGIQHYPGNPRPAQLVQKPTPLPSVKGDPINFDL